MTTKEQENRARANYADYRRSTWTEIYDAYDSFSKGKVDAWKYCKNLCEKFNGRDLKVIHKNCHKFTAGFEYTDPETCEIMFMYITKGSDTAVPVSS